MLLNQLSATARNLDESDIVAIMNHARDKADLIPLWVGEGDLATPQFIVDAANASLTNGETFYTWQRGIPELRHALADYHSRVYNIKAQSDRFFVTGSGMQSIQLSLQALLEAGDEVVMTTPCWPNIHAATQVAGGTPVHVELEFSEDGWSLELEKLFSAVTSKTKVIFINSPSNPTGWVAPLETLREILAFARQQGIWIVADEVYSRFTYSAERAPSFYDVIEDDDRVIFVNTFSKNWAMTGWRSGWISAPPELGQVIENLIQYSTSGVASFIQRGAVAALEGGEDFIAMQQARARQNRDLMCQSLRSTDRVRLAVPDGAFYLFFKIDGFPDSKKLAMQLIDEAGVGVAPGTGFYTGGVEYLRMCFLRDPKQIETAANRLIKCINTL